MRHHHQGGVISRQGRRCVVSLLVAAGVFLSVFRPSSHLALASPPEPLELEPHELERRSSRSRRSRRRDNATDDTSRWHLHPDGRLTTIADDDLKRRRRRPPNNARRLDETATTVIRRRSEDFGFAEVFLVDERAVSGEFALGATNAFYIHFNFIITISVTEGSFDSLEWRPEVTHVLDGDLDTCDPSCVALVVLPPKVPGGSDDVTVEFLRVAQGTAGVDIEVDTSGFVRFGDPRVGWDGTPFVPPIIDDLIRIDQGYYGAASHSTVAALDFSCPDGIGEPIYAARDGVVWQTVAEYFEQCDTFDDPAACVENNQLANKVYVSHCDGTSGLYVHFDGPDLLTVTVGQRVLARRDVLGPCGTTGISTGPHLHFQVDVPVFVDGADPPRLAASTAETTFDVCDGNGPVAPEVGMRWDATACGDEGFDCAAGSSGGSGGSSSKKKKNTSSGGDLSSATTLAAIDFAAFFVLCGVALILVGLARARLPQEASQKSEPKDLAVLVGVLILTWFTSCTDIALTYVEYSEEISRRAWAFSAATLSILFLCHAGVFVATATEYSSHDEDWVKENKWLVAPALLFGLPAVDTLPLVLPFSSRHSIHAFPNAKLAYASVFRALVVDAPQFLLKLVVYQSNVGFSVFAFVSALASLLTLFILAFRLVKVCQAPPAMPDAPLPASSSARRTSGTSSSSKKKSTRSFGPSMVLAEEGKSEPRDAQPRRSRPPPPPPRVPPGRTVDSVDDPYYTQRAVPDDGPGTEMVDIDISTGGGTSATSAVDERDL